MSGDVTFRVFRGSPDSVGDPFGKMVDYTVEMDEGMVVLDVIHNPGGACAGPFMQMELQGRKVWIMQCRGKWQARADVHD